MEYITLENVSKSIKGNTVLNNINLTFEKGKVYGLAGENGSGKTMLLRAISGLIKVNGNIYINGVNIKKEKSSEAIGIIIESIGLFGDLTAKENLELLNSFSINKISEKEIVSAIEAVGLNPNSNKPYKKYSLGMKQKLCIAQAIMAHPNILLLDEPTNALDEDSVVMFHNIVKAEKSRGATVIIASHNKDDLSILCDKIYKMKNGYTEGM